MMKILEKQNQPAISDEWAMQEYPSARNAELELLLNLTPLFPGCRVVDIQAAGGYLSDGVSKKLHGDVELICIEPVKALNQRLNSDYRIVEDSVEYWPSIESESVDFVIGLAGLHHSNDQQATVNEAFRVLKHGGSFIICDVVENSAVAHWLNEYVHQHNPNGHIGSFFSPNEVSELMLRSGFNHVQEAIKNVPWVLPNEDHMARFFKGLFGLNKPSINDIKKAIPNYLKLVHTHNQIEVEWNLIYAVAQKK